MRSPRTLLAAVIALAGFAAAAGFPLAPANAQTNAQANSRETIELAGRTLRCGHIRVMTDRHLPSEGAAAPGLLVLNPGLLNEQPTVVRLFVFHHECGHHNVGESELKADCWAVQHGVREGWLDAKGLAQVCRSFEDAPETPTHPSGRRRCRNLDQCFANAMAAEQAKKPAMTTAALPSSPAPSVSPRLVSGPTLIGTGTLRYAEPCRDPIGKLIEGKPPRAGCP